ncbi:hypothetical protein A2U01_0053787 [Trifolium medium]|uniref:Uncharacterized protein n=1 Tax=Trifolium medium TaxID=97028 RepID=A0A392R7J3_9FABA|nr:hypothetical protein [Trifolium medium]
MSLSLAWRQVAITSQKETPQLATTGDNWRRLATSSPPPRPVPSGDLKNGARLETPHKSL